QMKQMMEMMKKQQTANAEPPKPLATGQTEKVGQYDTEIYTWSNYGMNWKLWVAKNFPNFAKIKIWLEKMSKLAGGGMGKGMAYDPATLPGMVVKSEMEMSGGQKVTNTIISAKDDNIDPS